jgi:hypothetical protein
MTPVEELHLRPGEWVEVRTAQEILATLDDNGMLDHLPFMPEMLASCGKRFQVQQRADKTCDTVTSSGMRRMDRTVHLSSLRCDGAAHGGCQAGCLLFWKEAWLRRLPADDKEKCRMTNDECGGSTFDIFRTVTQGVGNDGETRYRCQATELLNASQPLPWWKPGQYFRDVFVNRVPWTDVVRGLACSLYSKLRRRLTGRGFPHLAGSLQKTPVENLGLQPGEWVIVKSREEIVATLDNSGRNRGLTFDAEMLPYCGKRLRVLRRIERIIEESTGRLIEPRGVSVVLENVVCRSVFRRSCPRCIFSYWREIWLRRDSSKETPAGRSELPIVKLESQLQTVKSC